MKRWMLVALVSLSLLVVLACGGTSNGGDTGGSAGGGTTGDMQIKVVNNSSDAVCYVYISPSDSTSWGTDQLGGDTIGAGASHTFDLEQNTYDINVQDCDEVTLATDWEVATNKTITVGERNAVKLLVDNRSSHEVCYVYISATDASDWGTDWLGMNESLPSGSRRIFFVQPGNYDLMAADCEAETLTEEYEVTLDSDLTWTLND